MFSPDVRYHGNSSDRKYFRYNLRFLNISWVYQQHETSTGLRYYPISFNCAHETYCSKIKPKLASSRNDSDPGVAHKEKMFTLIPPFNWFSLMTIPRDLECAKFANVQVPGVIGMSVSRAECLPDNEN